MSDACSPILEMVVLRLAVVRKIDGRAVLLSGSRIKKDKSNKQKQTKTYIYIYIYIQLTQRILTETRDVTFARRAQIGIASFLSIEVPKFSNE